MPGTAVTKSVVANDPGGRRREEIFVDIIEKISVTFSSSVSSYLLLVYYIKSTEVLACSLLAISNHPFLRINALYYVLIHVVAS